MQSLHRHSHLSSRRSGRKLHIALGLLLIFCLALAQMPTARAAGRIPAPHIAPAQLAQPGTRSEKQEPESPEVDVAAILEQAELTVDDLPPGYIAAPPEVEMAAQAAMAEEDALFVTESLAIFVEPILGSFIMAMAGPVLARGQEFGIDFIARNPEQFLTWFYAGSGLDIQATDARQLEIEPVGEASVAFAIPLSPEDAEEFLGYTPDETWRIDLLLFRRQSLFALLFMVVPYEAGPEEEWETEADDLAAIWDSRLAAQLAETPLPPPPIDLSAGIAMLEDTEDKLLERSALTSSDLPPGFFQFPQEMVATMMERNQTGLDMDLGFPPHLIRFFSHTSDDAAVVTLMGRLEQEEDIPIYDTMLADPELMIESFLSSYLNPTGIDEIKVLDLPPVGDASVAFVFTVGEQDLPPALPESGEEMEESGADFFEMQMVVFRRDLVVAVLEVFRFGDVTARVDISELAALWDARIVETLAESAAESAETGTENKAGVTPPESKARAEEERTETPPATMTPRATPTRRAAATPTPTMTSAAGNEGESILPMPTPTPPALTVRVAVHAPLSGPQSWLGLSVLEGAQLALREKEAALAEMGLTVEIVSYDDRASPAQGLENAQEMAEAEEILCMVGHTNSAVLIPNVEVYHAAGLAVVSPSATNPQVTEQGYVEINRVIGSEHLQGAAAAEYAIQELGAENVYIVHDTSAYGQGTAETFRAAAEAAGVEVLGMVGTTERKNFTRVLGPILAAEPDVIFFGGLYDQAAVFFRQVRESTLDSHLLGPDGLDSPQLAEIGGAAVVGAHYVTSLGPAASYPDAEAFVNAYVDAYGDSSGEEPPLFMVQAYDAMGVCLAGIEQAIADNGGRLPTRGEVAQAIRNLEGYTGSTGPIRFNEQGERLLNRYFVVEVASANPDEWSQNPFVYSIELETLLTEE